MALRNSIYNAPVQQLASILLRMRSKKRVNVCKGNLFHHESHVKCSRQKFVGFKVFGNIYTGNFLKKTLSTRGRPVMVNITFSQVLWTGLTLTLCTAWRKSGLQTLFARNQMGLMILSDLPFISNAGRMSAPANFDAFNGFEIASIFLNRMFLTLKILTLGITFNSDLELFTYKCSCAMICFLTARPVDS